MHEIYFKPSPIDHNIGTLNTSNWTITLKTISLKYTNDESKQLANQGREHHPRCVRVVSIDNMDV
jgi:hypothetical protein